MKQFQLNDKLDFSIYLHELIGRTDKCIVNQKRYLNKIERYLEEKIKNNSGIEPGEIIISYEEYQEFVDWFSSVSTYTLNLIGDNQSISMSYIKFRDMLLKRQKKGTLNFTMRELDEEVSKILIEMNKMRNWFNHVPESLLLSQIQLIKDGKLKGHTKNPINITYFKFCKLEVLQDLYKNEVKAYEYYRIVHQNMKKDYSFLIGQTTEIHRDYIDTPEDLTYFEPVALSAEVQDLKGTDD